MFRHNKKAFVFNTALCYDGFGRFRKGDVTRMLFSSLTFLLFFLPFVLIVHQILPRTLQNPFLLVSSLLFYAWRDLRYLPLFAGLLLLSWGAGLLIASLKNRNVRRAVLAGAVAIPAGTLLGYKIYASYGPNPAADPITGSSLPLGISFFLFQLIGYLVDVYREDTPPEKNVVAFGTFAFLFPQLVAGPIVRYSEIRKPLHALRRPGSADLNSGAVRFVKGLAFKVLLANRLGEAWNALSGISGSSVSSWLGILCFSLQIYFDFYGYSLMACGMGQMLGFSFPENFRDPYLSRTVSDFWRRWHITLGTWFRDYVYIPLGGNRKSLLRTLVNLFFVWMLTGLWHGAMPNFLLWGFWYFLFLAMERTVLKSVWARHPLLSRIVTLFAVVLGWVLFAFEDPARLASFTVRLFSFAENGVFLFSLRQYGLLLLVALLCLASPLTGKITGWLAARPIQAAVMCTVLLVLCMASLANATYNPFLYFRF